MNDFISIIDFIFNVQSTLWTQVITQNLYLSVMVVISLVALIFTIYLNSKQ